ncbi:MAG TPA: NADH-quinone oxidoreductase subunit NuoG [Woeseiaceae bacterium]|nr:NADH-quinone oxidoreductase subunit NuoG [Woeseiaceae bacterium]
MSDDIVNIEVDGKPVEARKGQMIIEATDAIGAYIPRFCYHEKLSIAANCRMCLVEVEKAPKPLPACATPIADGMKIFTKSPYAIAAQKATMEFLLINHPLDCPICDQGGECELQDLAMGYGRDVSRYNAGKRVVKDKNIGPLVSTDMTRCIHCTRCVRFGEEIAGIPLLGTTGRGENMKIGTYIEQSVDHELSGNIIDLCPVGALNNKPYRYSARAWEMTQRATVSPHDCVGSNMYAHVLRGTVKRIVPRENESINETWLADRDRFSYEAIYSEDRLTAPRIKHAGEWRDIDWEEALTTVADAIKKAAADRIGILAAPWITAEEAHLLSGIAAYVGTSNIDYRIRQRDFSDQDNDPVCPSLGCDIADVEKQGAILVIGSNIREEAPILAHRVRKAALAGADVSFINSREHKYFFDVANSLSGGGLVELLAGVAVAACEKSLPAAVQALCEGVTPGPDHEKIAASLKNANKALVMLGNVAGRHRALSAVRALAAAIAAATGATFGSVSEGPNSAGAALAGVLPHRGLGGVRRAEPGLHAGDMPGAALDVLMLVNVEPDADILATDDAVDKIKAQNFTVALTPFASESLLEAADLLLPIGTFAESSGTYVNAAGTWQSFPGVANPVGEARPAWKVLRVIGNLLDAPGFEYVTSEEVLAELREQLGDVRPDNSYAGSAPISCPDGADAPGGDIDIPLYSVDPVVRRAKALQLTDAARRARGEGVEP